MNNYIERFGVTVHSHLNLIHVGTDDVESQNFVCFSCKKTLISSQMFSALSVSLVNKTKHSIEYQLREVHIFDERSKKVKNLLKVMCMV